MSSQTYTTPPQVAERLGVSETKVLKWIASGELRAVDLSTRRGERPRWRISEADLEAFLTARSNAAAQAGKPRRRRQRDKSIIEFF